MLWNTPEVKQLNCERIRREIQNNPKCTKAMVAKQTELSVATCNTIFNELLDAGEIRIADQEEAAMGRPALRFEYNEDYRHVLGIRVTVEEKETIHYLIANALGEMIKTGKAESKSVDGAKVLKVIENCIAEDELIRCVSIGVPGVTSDGVIENCDIEGLTGEPLEKKIRKQFDIDVTIQNDMDVISYGVYQETFKDKGNLAAILFPSEGESYVGAGMIIDGKILFGATQFAGELRYIGEAFGITLTEMKKIRKDKEKLIDFASKMAVVLISTIDPKKIVVVSRTMEERDAFKIREQCAKVVTEAHVPEMTVENEVDSSYDYGLVELALNKVFFPLSEPVE